MRAVARWTRARAVGRRRTRGSEHRAHSHARTPNSTRSSSTSFAAHQRASCARIYNATPPSIDDPTGRRSVRAAEDRTAISRARQSRRVPAAALDADGGGRSRRRMVRERAAARDGRRRRPRSVRFSGHGRPAAPRCCCCSAPVRAIRSRPAGSPRRTGRHGRRRRRSRA